MANKASKKDSRKAQPTQAQKAAAAVEETDPTTKTIEWRGHTFDLPDELPKSLSFRMSQIQEADNAQPMLGLLQSLLNKEDETQYGIVIREIERADDEEEVIEDAYKLVGEILKQYGTSEGESGASQDS